MAPPFRFLSAFLLSLPLTSPLACLANSYQAPFGTSHGKTRTLTPEIIQYINDVALKNGIPGLAVSVAHVDDEPEYASWGNSTEEGDDVERDTLFYIGSCSKAFVSISLGILIDDYAAGQNSTALPNPLTSFDWDTRIKDLLPDEWSPMDPWTKEKATLKDILTHSSGLPRHDMSYSTTDNTTSILSNLSHLRFAFELREQFSYNNIMYMIAAHIVSKLSGVPFTSFVEKRIFAPLGMNSFYSVDAASKTGMMSHAWSPDGRRIPWWFPGQSAEFIAGPGGIIASAKDLAKWLKFLLNGGVNPDTNTTLLSPSSFDGMTTSYSIFEGKSLDPSLSIIGIGLGWFRMSFQGHDVISIPGGLPGYTSLIAFAPADGIGVSITSNTASVGSVIGNSNIVSGILQAAFDSNDTSNTGIHTAMVQEAALIAQMSPVIAPQSRGRTPSFSTIASTHDLSGTYHNVGYGTLTLCAPTSTSDECSRVLAEFEAVNASVRAGELVASWPRFWVSHVRLTPTSTTCSSSTEDVVYHFDATVSSHFPNGYGKNTTPFVMAGSEFPIDFVVGHEDGLVRGFGLRKTSGPQMTRREKVGRDAEELADAWFVKQ